MALSIDYVLRETASNLWRNRLMTLAAVLTVAVSLSLVGAALLLKQGVDRASGNWRGGVQLIVFMQPTATAAQTDAVHTSLSRDSEVKSFDYVDQAASYAEFKSLFASQPDFLAAVSAADLPPSFRIILKNADQASGVGASFQGDKGVQKVDYDRAGVDTMLKVTNVIQDVIVGIAIVLLISAAVLILNTIRIAIFGRRREVTVMKLVGATNWFIRVPFMLEGLIQGILGAAVAAFAVFGIRAGVETLISRFNVTLLDPIIVPPHQALVTQLVVLAMGALVGAVGSALAVRRFLEV